MISNFLLLWTCSFSQGYVYSIQLKPKDSTFIQNYFPDSYQTKGRITGFIKSSGRLDHYIYYDVSATKEVQKKTIAHEYGHTIFSLVRSVLITETYLDEYFAEAYCNMWYKGQSLEPAMSNASKFVKSYYIFTGFYGFTDEDDLFVYRLLCAFAQPDQNGQMNRNRLRIKSLNDL